MWTGRTLLVAMVLTVGFLAMGCRQDMHDQPRIDPLEAHDFFSDGMGARPLPAGTVPRGHLYDDTHLYEGKDTSGEFVTALPAGITLDRALLEHGRDRFEVYCTPCHDSTGRGTGMIVRRGFKPPPPFSEQRLVDMPLGYFFDVMTQGFGVMSSYKNQLPVADRWAVTAYIRVLQASQTRRLDDLPAALQQEFQDHLARADEPPPADEEHH